METTPTEGRKQCAYCGRQATHFCTGCGNWVCDGALCAARAAAKTLQVRVLGMLK